jgi:hypothetical protein
VPARGQGQTVVGKVVHEAGIVAEQFVGAGGERVDRRHPAIIAVGTPRGRTVASGS